MVQAGHCAQFPGWNTLHLAIGSEVCRGQVSAFNPWLTFICIRSDRLVYVAQKYNPTRMFTPEGTVGLGGPLLVSESATARRGTDSCSSHLTSIVQSILWSPLVAINSGEDRSLHGM